MINLLYYVLFRRILTFFEVYGITLFLPLVPKYLIWKWHTANPKFHFQDYYQIVRVPRLSRVSR
jgi:hypothetical protein